MTLLANLFENLGSFEVTLSIGGTLGQPVMALSSSVTKRLASGLQNFVQAELKGLQNGFNKALTSRVERYLTEADRETDTLEKMLQKELSSRLSLARSVPKKTPGREKPIEKIKPFDLLKKKGLKFSKAPVISGHIGRREER